MNNKRKSNDGRLSYIDKVKGIGIILVIAGHSSLLSDDMLTWVASFHMPLFFLISGILFSYREEAKGPPEQFFKKRAMGMLIPYLVFSLIYFGVYKLMSIQNPEVITQDVLILSALQFISGYGMSVLWFLTAIFSSEAVLYVGIRAISKNRTLMDAKPWIKALLTAALLEILAVAGLFGRSWAEVYKYNHEGYPGYFVYYFMISVSRIFPGLIFLICGMLIYRLLCRLDFAVYGKLKTEKKRYPVGEVLTGVLLIILSAALAMKNGRVDLHFLVFDRISLFYPAAVLTTLGIILICRNLRYVWLLEFFGANSLIVMLTHVDCQVMYVAQYISRKINQVLSINNEIFFRFNFWLFILAFEGIIIVLINKWFYFLIGRTKPVKMNLPDFVKKIIKKVRGRKFKVVK